jgi:hypothetical protein
VDEGAEDGLARQLDEVLARFAAARALDKHLANPEVAIDEPIEGDAARRQIPTDLARREVDAVFAPQSLERLGFDQGEVATYVRVAPVALAACVAISDETRTRGDLGLL